MDNMDNNDKKLKFIEAMTKHGLKHFDGGGLLGGISSLLGTNNDYQYQNAPTADQLNQAATGTTGAIGQQQNFVNQASAQNGFGNQSNVFAQQQALSNQLQNQANGQGPNPAQAALNQSTGQNVANQGALMAGQRGASGNVGLLARQAAQQGAATQQQAVGQGATLQAQQQIAAQQALAAQQAQMQGVAANQISTQGGATNSLTAGQLQNQNQLLGANTQANAVNAGVASGNQSMMGTLIGGALSGAAVAAGKPPSASAGFKGGESEHLQHISNIYYPNKTPMNVKSGGSIPGKSPINHDSLKNDTVPAMLSKGEGVIDLDTMNDPGPMGQMARAVLAHIKKKNSGKK